MISFQNIGLLFQFEAYNEVHKFSKIQSDELYNIGIRISNIDSKVSNMIFSIKKYKNLEKEYINKFESFGGNMQILDAKLREYENKNVCIINDLSEKLKVLRKIMKV